MATISFTSEYGALDVPYVRMFVRELAPAFLDHVAILSGVAPPVRQDGAWQSRISTTPKESISLALSEKGLCVALTEAAAHRAVDRVKRAFLRGTNSLIPPADGEDTQLQAGMGNSCSEALHGG